MHDMAEIAPLLQREGGGDSGNELGRHGLGARGGRRCGDSRGRSRSRRWRGNAGIAGVVMFSLAFLGLGVIFKTIQGERTTRSSSTLQEMSAANTRPGSTGPDSRTQEQSGEIVMETWRSCLCVLVWLAVRDGELVKNHFECGVFIIS